MTKQYSNAIPVKRPDPPDVTRNRFIMAIVDAACEYRDLDWDRDDPSGVCERLDAAIDAWRKHLLSNKPPKRIKED